MSQIVQTRRHMAVTILATGFLAAALAGPAVASQDLRSPDARDAGRLAQQARGVDLRSPDARDAARPAQEPRGGSGSQDLRSPDARDVRVFPNVSSPSTDSSADLTWVYLAIGALGLIGIVEVAVTIRRRRRQPVAVRG
jgi:hypothetical protein